MIRVERRRGLLGPILILSVAVVANAAVFFTVTYPRHRELDAALTAHDAAERELHAVRQQLRTLQVLGGDALRARDDLRAFLAGQVSSISRLTEALAFLRRSSTDAGVRLENIDYSVEPVDQLGVLSLAMSVRGAGSYRALRQWIGDLRMGSGLMFVDSVEIAGSGGPVLSVELTVVAMLRAAEVGRP